MTLELNVRTIAMATLCALMLAPPSPGAAEASGGEGRLLIWDDRPAEEWDVGYPVGNGRLFQLWRAALS